MFNRKNIAATVGNFFEWYDFCLYGYFAPLLAHAFYSNDSRYLGLVYIFLTFAAGYMARPIGGVIFGHLGDVIGRGKALYYSIVLIAIPTFLIGFLPDAHAIGFIAPLLLLLFRCLQGLSAGGQYSGSLSFLREHNQPNQGAKAVSLAYVGSLTGYLCASCIGALSTHLFHSSFAWRTPFLFTGLCICVLPFCKKGLIEMTKNTKKPDQYPIVRLCKKYKMLTFKTTILACIGGIYYSSFFIFLISYLNVHVGLPLSSVLGLNTLSLVSSGFAIMFFANLADRYGRKPLLVLSSLSLAVLIYPAFLLMNSGVLVNAFLGVWLLTTANTAFMAGCAVVYVELFPEEVRYTGCAIAYNIGAGLIGGLVPVALTLILHHFGHWVLASFLIASALFSVFFIYKTIPETIDREDVYPADVVESVSH